MAIKQIDLYSISSENIRSIESEINLLKKLDHPNIVKYIECIQTKTHINLVLEYVEGGSLHQILKQTGKMPEHLVFIFVKQILNGLDYLHNQGIIHRDIKGANLLLTKEGIVKLADFGYSILNDKNKANSLVGTSCWMAPEVIEQKGSISPKCDIWSLGSTIIQLLTTLPPYYEFSAMGAMFRIVQDKCPPLPPDISPNLRDFLLKCFEKEPKNRASAKELLMHPWMTTPNKKLVKKFIYENDNSFIPVNLINEWKNNYRDNLSSITSSQNENNNCASAHILGNRSKSKSNSVAEINANDIDIKKDPLLKSKRKDMSSPKSNYTRHNKLIEIGRIETKKSVNSNRKKGSTKEKGFHSSNSNSSKEKMLQYSNLSLKNLNGTKSPKKQIIHTTQSNENIKTISFNDDGFIYRSTNSIIAESENEVGYDDNNNTNILMSSTNNLGNTNSKAKPNSLLNEIDLMLETLNKSKEDNIIKLTTSMNLTNNSNTQSRGKKGEWDGTAELKNIINDLHFYLCNTNQTNTSSTLQAFTPSKNILFILVRLHNTISKKPPLLLDFFSSFNFFHFCSLFTIKQINSKIIHILLDIINIGLSKDSSMITDVILSQSLFHLSRYIHLFTEPEIKIEIISLISYCIRNTQTATLFIGSGGIYLIISLLDASFLFVNYILLLLTSDYLLTLFSLIPSKDEEICLLLITNKIYSRLNMIIIDIFNSEDSEMNSNSTVIIDRVFTLLLKLTSCSSYLYLICNDKLIVTLIQAASASNSITSSHIQNLLRIFDNIMLDVSNLNKLENFGYIDTLIKLLTSYAYDTGSNIDYNAKTIETLVNQLNQMIKLNRSRSEAFAMSEGIDIMCALATASGDMLSSPIIDILSELINASDYTREKLKASKTLELIVSMITTRSDKETVKELSQLILDWIGFDKSFVEDFIVKEDNFTKIFDNLNYVLSENMSEYLSMLNDFFRSSEIIEGKFFNNASLVKNVVAVLNNSNYITMKDIHLMNKIMDFYEFLTKHKVNDSSIMNKVAIHRTLEKIKELSKEKRLIIIDEKIKKINSYLNK